MNIKVLISCVVILVSGITYAGEIFKCTNEKSEVYYNDKPCPANEIERKMQAVKDPKNPYQFESNEFREGKNRENSAANATKISQNEVDNEKLDSESSSYTDSYSASKVNNSTSTSNESSNSSTSLNEKLSYSPKNLDKEKQKSEETKNGSNRDNHTASIGVLEIELHK